MTDRLFERVLLPVADEDDAEATCRAARPYIEGAVGRAVAVHVIEKAGGAPDKASVEQRKLVAEEIFDVVRASLSGLPVETEIAYGTDVAEAIFDVAAEVDATAIVFTPRSGSRWVRLLTGDVAMDLITKTDRPVIVLPDEGEADGGDGTPGSDTGDGTSGSDTGDGTSGSNAGEGQQGSDPGSEESDEGGPT